jgi:hypothetical protein
MEAFGHQQTPETSHHSLASVDSKWQVRSIIFGNTLSIFVITVTMQRTGPFGQYLTHQRGCWKDGSQKIVYLTILGGDFILCHVMERIDGYFYLIAQRFFVEVSNYKLLLVIVDGPS